MIKQLLKWFNPNDNDVVMDFFSGSATTAHAVMQYNVETNKNVKYVMIQIPEKISEIDVKYEHNTIDQIGMCRIKNVTQKIIKQNSEIVIDLGFKHYTLKDVM